MPASLQAQFECTTNADGVSLTIIGYTGAGGNVVIPSTINNMAVTAIGTNAFEDCTSLTGISIPGGITNIEAGAFYGCDNLSSATISEGVTNIGDQAFGDCSSLGGISLPASVAIIGEGVFESCFNLTTIGVASQNSNYTSAGGVLFNKSKSVLVGFPCGLNGAYTIPASVTNIVEAAFAGATSLTHVTIPTSVSSIGEAVFSNCYDMVSATIPGSVTNIGSYAFFGCNELSIPTLPTNLMSIGAEAFYECFDISSVNIPNSVVNIGPGSFAFCVGLKTITVDSQNLFYSSTNGVLFDKNQISLLEFPAGVGGTYAIPNGTTAIGASAFEGCQDLVSVSIPPGVGSIGDHAFAYCYDLTSAAMPESVTNLGDSAFYGCEVMTNATISGGMTSLGDYAFYGCYGLTSLTIPGSITNLGDGSFEWCKNLTNICFEGEPPQADASVFLNDKSSPTAYYLPGATNWSSNFDGLPALLWNALIQTNEPNFGVQLQQFGFNIIGTTNIPVLVQACANLANPAWTPLANVLLTNGSYYFSDAGWTNFSSRFYRIKLP